MKQFTGLCLLILLVIALALTSRTLAEERSLVSFDNPPRLSFDWEDGQGYWPKT